MLLQHYLDQGVSNGTAEEILPTPIEGQFSTRIDIARHIRWLQRGRKGYMVPPETQRIREAIGMGPITARDTSQTVAHMFNLMDASRHLPGYGLEGRLAPFFELFLLDVLGELLDVDLHPVVIPEFPLRKGTLNDNNSNQSYNVDYVAFSMDRREAFLVELKTDMSSIDRDQEKYLRLARKSKLRPLVGGIVKICGSKDSKRAKYVHLLHLLAKLELVTIPNQSKLYQMTFPSPKSGWTKSFAGVIPAVEGKLEHARVIYIQPRKDKSESDNDFKYIYFRDVAEIVQRFGDLGSVFAHYLRKWSDDPGRRYPRTVAHRS